MSGPLKSGIHGKIGIVVEEADETVFWIELLSKTGIIAGERCGALLKEANKLLAIFGSSLKTAKPSRL